MKDSFDKYIYIEIGVDKISSSNKFFFKNRDKQWTFELFEPNIHTKSRIEKGIRKLRKRGVNVNFHEVGAYSSNTTMKLYPGNGKKGQSQESSTFYKGRVSFKVKYDSGFKIRCIDFDEWVKKNLNKEHYIYMKMNAEGAEYEILPKMIEGGSIDYINSVHIYFHYYKFDEKNGKRFKKKHDFLKEFFLKREFDIKRLKGMDGL